MAAFCWNFRVSNWRKHFIASIVQLFVKLKNRKSFISFVFNLSHRRRDRERESKGERENVIEFKWIIRFALFLCYFALRVFVYRVTLLKYGRISIAGAANGVRIALIDFRLFHWRAYDFLFGLQWIYVRRTVNGLRFMDRCWAWIVCSLTSVCKQQLTTQCEADISHICIYHICIWLVGHSLTPNGRYAIWTVWETIHRCRNWRKWSSVCVLALYRFRQVKNEHFDFCQFTIWFLHLNILHLGI